MIAGRTGSSADGRGRGIRTPDILLPKQARYQTALYPGAARLVRVPRPVPRPRKAGHCPERAMRCQRRSEEHTSELQSLMRISYAVFCLKKKTDNSNQLVSPIQSTQ